MFFRCIKQNWLVHSYSHWQPRPQGEKLEFNEIKHILVFEKLHYKYKVLLNNLNTKYFYNKTDKNLEKKINSSSSGTICSD